MNALSAHRNPRLYRKVLMAAILTVIAVVAFVAGLAYSSLYAEAADAREPAADSQPAAPAKGNPKVIYPKRTELDFEGLKLQGEVRSPGEFYFLHRNEEKFDSLVKRRKNFHQQMLRDAVMSK